MVGIVLIPFIVLILDPETTNWGLTSLNHRKLSLS